MGKSWMISVRYLTQRKDFRLTQHEGETPLELYRRVKREGDKITARYAGKPVTVDLISLSQAFKKPDVRPPKNHKWCPYCRKFRIFTWDSYVEVDRCPVCHITVNDYWVKYYNGIFLGEKLLMLQEKGNKK